MVVTTRRRLPLQEVALNHQPDDSDEDVAASSPSVGEKLQALEAEQKRRQEEASSSDESSSDEDSLEEEQLPPSPKKKVMFELSDDSDLDSEKEDEEEEASGASASDNQSNPAINLKCMKSIEKYYKDVKLWKLQPSNDYRVTLVQLSAFMAMDKPEQKAAKAAFSKRKQAEKGRVKASIPGVDCSCCKSKSRKDQGKKRGSNAATTAKAKKSRRQQGQEPEPATTTDGEQPEPKSTGTAWVSLGHSPSEREGAHSTEEPPAYKRQGIRMPEYARSIQMQGSEQSLKALNAAIATTIRAASVSTRAPKLNPATGLCEHDQRTEVPRVRVLLVIVNEVGETCMSGSTLPADKLRRPKPRITYVSACKEDAKHVFKTLCAGTGALAEDIYEKKFYYGTGAAALSRHTDDIATRKAERKRKTVLKDSMQETQQNITYASAPAM